MQTAISVNKLDVTVDGKNILQDINFDIDEQDILFILGGNGSGKTTLIKTILGLIPHTAGEVKIFGEPRTQETIAKCAGYIPQYTNIERDFPISVKEIIELECNNTNGCRIDVADHLDILNIRQLMDRNLKSLSGGEMQKVLISRALVSNPKILIMDEPTNNLDEESEEDLFKLIRQLQKEGGGKTILVVTHDHNLVRKQDRLIYLEHGKLSKHRHSLHE